MIQENTEETKLFLSGKLSLRVTPVDYLVPCDDFSELRRQVGRYISPRRTNSASVADKYAELVSAQVRFLYNETWRRMGPESRL